MHIKEFSGPELHDFLEYGLLKFGVGFEDVNLYGSKDVFKVALGDEYKMFANMVEQKYISLCDEHGKKIYGDYYLFSPHHLATRPNPLGKLLYL